MDVKIVFLDFDGVLNHIAGADANRAVDAPIEPARPDSAAARIDPVAVERINVLLRRTDAQIVVSSTWRDQYSLEELRAMLVFRGLAFPERIIDVTPQMWRDDRVRRHDRGREIQSWIDSHPGIEEFVIIDDNNDMLHLLPLLVQTSMERGLLDEHIEIAVAILGETARG